MSEISLNTIITSQGNTGDDRNPAKIQDAARQFEAMLIQQMLQSARASNGDEGQDQTGSVMTDMAEQQFSKLLASNGGVGLARLVVDGLKRE